MIKAVLRNVRQPFIFLGIRQQTLIEHAARCSYTDARMKNSSIEITEQEYLIKLPREDFNLSFIHQLLKRIQAEQLFFKYPAIQDDDDLISRNINMDRETRYDDLRDK